MKKIIFCVMALFATSMMSGSFCFAGEQICKINESGDSVEVFNAYIKDGNKVCVSLSNDSQATKANVTVIVEVKYGPYKKSYAGKQLAGPGSSVLEIPIDTEYNRQTPSSVSVISISGNKCI